MTNEEILTQIDTNVRELLQWKSALNERCQGHRDLTDEVRATIYGNPGKSDGLQFDVSRLINGKVARGRKAQFWSYVLRGIILTIIIGFATVVGTALLTYLKG